MAWGIAGLSAVCKTVRAGFDSLPRLHIFVEMPRSGIRWPDDYSRARLARLALDHHAAHVKDSTRAAMLSDKVAVLSRNLSAYKRHFGSLPPEISAKLPTVHDVNLDWSGEMTGFREKLKHK